MPESGPPPTPVRTDAPPPGRRTDPFGPLRRPDYRRFWLGLIVASIAYWMFNVAASWLMKEWTAGDPFMVALVQTSISLPVMFMAIPAGVLADLFDRRRFLIFSQIWMLCAAAAMGTAIAFGLHSPWLLLVFTAVLGLGHAMKLPSQAASVPELAGRDQLAAAISFNSMAINGARIVGPALGGAALPVVGARTTFFAAAAGFLIYAFAVFLWRRPYRRPPARGQRLIDVVLGGFRFARRTAPFRATLIRCALFFIAWSVVLAILPNLVTDVDTFGQIYACFGVGGVLGGLSYPYADRRAARELLLSLGIGLQAVGLVLLGLFSDPWAMAGTLVLIGFASMYAMISVQTSAQIILPEELRARGMSLINMTMMGASSVGSPLWGAVAKFGEPAIALFAAAGFSLVCLVFTARLKVTEASKSDD
ncbi:MAG: MFS transporter [Rhodospirillaceae bacterium]|nr:MFS transporter [Rhodospirillaceae bacterium]